MIRVRVNVRRPPGHHWIFSNEVVEPPVATLPAGGAVEVFDTGNRRLGRGYSNPNSLIAIRLLTRGDDDIDAPAFYMRRLRDALSLRQRLLPGRTSYRLSAGEADGLPGLLIDRYGDVLSVQVTTLGMEKRLGLLENAIKEVVAPAGAVLRDDVSTRRYEGLSGEARVWFGEVPETVSFEENGLRLQADVLHGQKTGFFFDQADNRAFLHGRVAGATVLDVFSHIGAWAVGALVHGAASAVTLDSSAPACALIGKIAAENGVADRLEVHCDDAREGLAKLGRRFDVVCVDPPAFAKTRKTVGVALAGYKTVNAAALRLVSPGGLFFTSSCSHHVLPERFEETILAAARSAGRDIVLVRRGGQAPDHPILPAMPETAYLKHLVFVVR